MSTVEAVSAINVKVLSHCCCSYRVMLYSTL